ncbi:hypothetical protein [Comamonas sp. B-9]|uniref:hypothetical protein n=1 Tax=Comamonas sp. B-9 TaxID=1055192 RepID=UPI0011DDED3B|nr:hypothetical protein [Comamonas sp. B-9]
MLHTTSLLAEHFSLLAAQPCWQCTANYGSWLSLHFGQPRIVVREPVPNAKALAMRRRRADVQGDFLLWIEMAAWEYSEDDKPLLHSEQPRESLQQAAARLQGQCISGVRLLHARTETIFDFDQGGQLRVWPHGDARADDPLWHLYLPEKILTLQANGHIAHGSLSQELSSFVPNETVSVTLG